MKKITIINKSSWKEVFVVIYTTSMKRKIRLDFENNLSSFLLDETKEDRFCLTNGKRNYSEVIYADGLNDTYILKYNKKTKKNSIFIKNIGKIGNIEEIILEDKKNLFYAKGKKKIYISYPSGYDAEKEYGLVLSFDGQNCFYFNGYDKKNVYGGVQLDVLNENRTRLYHHDYVIIGIDNASNKRDEELTMPLSFGKIADFVDEDPGLKQFKKGKLNYLMKFIIETVLPFVFSKIKVDKSRISIVGASSGGLASFYAALTYPEIFSSAACLSPALFFFDKESYIKIIEKVIKNGKMPKLYFYCGSSDKLEKNLVVYTKEIPKMMLDKGYMIENIKIRILKEGIHNEAYWRLAYDEAFNYIF